MNIIYLFEFSRKPEGSQRKELRIHQIIITVIVVVIMLIGITFH